METGRLRMENAHMGTAGIGKSVRKGWVLAAVVWVCGAAAQAEVIDSADFFTPLTHTLLTFEVDGHGNPVTLGEGGWQSMPGGEYRSQGVVFLPGILWVNDGAPEVDVVLTIGGSPKNCVTSFQNDFVTSFTTPVYAFGCWVLHNRDFGSRPILTAYAESGAVIERVVFEGSLVDGAIAPLEYGFMGIASPFPIARVRIQKEAAEFDDFRFTTVRTALLGDAFLAF